MHCENIGIESNNIFYEDFHGIYVRCYVYEYMQLVRVQTFGVAHGVFLKYRSRLRIAEYLHHYDFVD